MDEVTDRLLDAAAEVFAERGYERDGASWDEPIELRRLDSANDPEFDAMLADLHGLRSGIRRMDRDGVDSLLFPELFELFAKSGVAKSEDPGSEQSSVLGT